MNSNLELLYIKQLSFSEIKKTQEQRVEVDSNSSKVIKKIQEIILKKISHHNSKLYFSKALYPTHNITEITRRQHHIKELMQIIKSKNVEFEKEKIEKREKNSLKLTNIEELFTNQLPIRFPYTLYTCDRDIYNEFENFSSSIFNSISIQLLSEKELQEIEHQGDFNKETFVVSDERYLGEITQLRSKELYQLIQGFTNSKRVKEISIINSNANMICPAIAKHIKELFKLCHDFSWDITTISQVLKHPFKEHQEQEFSFIKNLEEKIAHKNIKLKEVIQKTQLQLQGEDLIDLLHSDNVEELKKKLQQVVIDEINVFEKELREDLKSRGFKDRVLITKKSYPLTIDDDIKDELIDEFEGVQFQKELDYYFSFSTPKQDDISIAIEYLLCYDVIYSLFSAFMCDDDNNNVWDSYPQFSNSLYLEDILNIFIPKGTPVSYALHSNSIKDVKLKNEKVAILTGANSGGKTTLLELLLSSQYLGMCGFPLHSTSDISLELLDVEEIIYLKKFTGTQGSGAFEQTIKQLLSIMSQDTKKLLLIDEFEAITEPGAAAKILIAFLEEIASVTSKEDSSKGDSKKQTYCVAVSHLGKDILKHLQTQSITSIRVDGISAKGLDESGNLVTNHQPMFNELGSSTPELILKRIYQDEHFFKSIDRYSLKTDTLKSHKLKLILEKMMK